MVANLQEVNLSRPEQFVPVVQGEDLDNATHSALAGSLVSSLHRLKDIDNTGESIKRSRELTISLTFPLLKMEVSLCFQIFLSGLRVNSGSGSVFSRC